MLNFNDRTYAEFFREHGINIDAEKYRVNGSSKMRRLRSFWEIESDAIVAKALSAMLEYACAVEKVDGADRTKATSILSRLSGKAPNTEQTAQTQEDFLKQVFSALSRHAQCRRQMRLACPRATHQHHVLCRFGKADRCQLTD